MQWLRVGGRPALVLIGFDEDVLTRAGLGAAIGTDPVLQIAGGQARWARTDRLRFSSA